MKFSNLLASIFLFVAPALAANPAGPGNIPIGYLPTTLNTDGTRTFNLAAGARWEAFSFILSETKTLNTIKWFMSANTGAASGDFRFDIYSDNSDVPNVSLANSVVTTGTPGTNAWLTNTGYSLSLTAGTRYWVVEQNVNVSPTTVYWSTITSKNILPPSFTQGNDTGSSVFGFVESITSGAAWANDAGGGVFPLVLGFSDGTFFGFPVGLKKRALDAGTTYAVYSGRKHGMLITTPADAKLRVKCLTFQIGKNGTPTGNLQYEIWTGTSTPTLVDTTSITPAANVDSTGGGNFPLCFPTARELSANTTYRFVVAESTQSDASTDRLKSTYYTNVDSAASSQALKFWGASAASTYCTGTCTAANWTENTTEMVPFLMTLDAGDEFGTQSAGGGIKNLNSVSGGAQ